MFSIRRKLQIESFHLVCNFCSLGVYESINVLEIVFECRELPEIYDIFCCLSYIRNYLFILLILDHYICYVLQSVNGRGWIT